MTTVAVYGTLRKGERINGLMDGAKYIGKARVEGFSLKTNGSYPYAVAVENSPLQGVSAAIIVELYEVTDLQQLDRLDRIEAEYNRTEVTAELLKTGSRGTGTKVAAEMYVARRGRHESFPWIPSGDWKKR